VHSGSDKLNEFGLIYQYEIKQYDNALAWYLLAARENNAAAQNNVGVSFNLGLGVPKNYLCALKWYLKSAEQKNCDFAVISIGMLLENGHGVPLDKYRALEWYCRGKDKRHSDRLKSQGYHRSGADKSKLNCNDGFTLLKETNRKITPTVGN
jgi:TPR repeat protein